MEGERRGIDTQDPEGHSPQVLVALPAFNEEKTIGSLVLKARRHGDCVLVIDDGSRDATAEVASLAGAEVISHGRNLGKGMAVRTAFWEARRRRARILVLLDADGQHDPGEIPRLLGPILQDKADMVVGARVAWRGKGPPLYRRFGQGLLTRITNLFSEAKLSDTQSGFRAFSQKAIQGLRFQSRGMGIESEMQLLFRNSEFRVVEVPISSTYDVEGSVLHPLAHGTDVLSSIVRYTSQERPLTVFGVPGFLLSVLGVGGIFWVVYRYAVTQALAIGTLLLATLVLLIGIFSVFTGIILHSTARWMREMKREK
jgi:glycosyltransferase involved in cell wall biosynthesis